MSLFETPRKNSPELARDDSSARLLTKPEVEEMLLESGKVLEDLKAPPKEKRVVTNGSQVRDSYSGHNQQAMEAERVIRESGLANGISPDEMPAEIELAKNYVLDAGIRKEEAVTPKGSGSPEQKTGTAWEQGMAEDMKLATANANGIPVSQTTPNANAVAMAASRTNASPQALAIQDTNSVTLPMSEEIEIQMLKVIADSQERIVSGQQQAARKLHDQESVQATFDRIRDIARGLRRSESLVIQGGLAQEQQSYSLGA